MHSYVCSRAHVAQQTGVLQGWIQATGPAPGGLLTALLRDQKRVCFRARQIVFHERDPADSVFLLATGTACLYRFLPNGRRVIARFLFAGDIVGLSFDKEYSFTAECITPATAYKLSRADFRSFCNHSAALQNDVVLLLQQKLASVREDHLPMMHQAAHARLASLLRMIARRNGAECYKGESILLPMTRSDIADYLGITIETVCRRFTKLKDDGLISASAPHQIRIEDAHKLTSLADGEG